MRPVVDALGHPPVDALVAAGVDLFQYTDAGRPTRAYLDGCDRAGVAVTFVVEEVSSTFQGPPGTGARLAATANRRVDEVGYGGDLALWYVVSDGTATDPHTGADRIAANAAEVVRAGGRPAGWYGNRYAVTAALSGAQGASVGTWVPRPWGGDANVDVLVQESDTESPVAGTDLNSVHGDYRHAGGVVPAPTTGDSEPMAIIKENRDGGLPPQWWLPTGAALVKLADAEAWAWVVGAKVPVVEYPTLGLVGLAKRMASANGLPFPIPPPP
jgi:hypothetical protein